MGHALSLIAADPQLREIRLAGWLGAKYGRVHWLAVRTPSQAVRLLAAIFPGFMQDFCGLDGQQRWRVWVGDQRMIDGAEAAMYGTARILIAPVIRGAGIKLNISAVLGVVLMGAAIYATGGLAAAAVAGGGWGIAFSVGAGMLLNGVIQMLTPIPKADSTRDKRTTFDGPVQLSAAGNAIPVALGIVFTGSMVISGSVHLDQVESDTPEAIDDVSEEPAGTGSVVTTTSQWGIGFRIQQAIQTATPIKSHAYARFLDAVSVGPIRGFVTTDPLKSIYFDDVPVRAADGTVNFDDTFVAFRLGSQDQPEVRGFDAVENEIVVGVAVTYDTPIVRSVSNGDLTAVLVRLKWPSLMHFTSKGKQRGSSAGYAIDVSADGGSYVTVIEQTLMGKTTSAYERQHRITLEPDAGPWNIRVRRTTEDSDSPQTANAFSWESYTEVIDVRLRYPRTALVALSLDSEQFSTPNPARAYHLYGYAACWMPSNYDPDARTYTGIWDGTLKQGWTNNPAWIFYTALRDRIWGLGRRVSTNVLGDLLPALYAAGRYADEPVPNGEGGFEPRFTCNTWLSSRQDAWKLLDQLVSVFRGMHYWAAGSVNASYDAPGDVVARFNQANVIDGRFQYEGTSKSVDFSVVIAYYNDPTDMGRRRPVRVQDDELVLRRGYVPKEIEAFACASRGQAIRLARAVIAASKLEGRTVTFATGAEGAFVSPGQIIEISDPKKAGVRLAGRLLRSTPTSITLDAPVTLQAGQTYTLTIVEQQDQPIVRTVTTLAGTTSVINWADALDLAPAPMSLWVLGSDAIQPTLWRVVRVAESEPWQWTITAMRYAPEKYAYIDSDAEIPAGPVTSIYQAPAKPTGIVGGEALYLAGSTQIMQTSFSWQPSAGAVRYIGRLSAGDDNPIEFDTQIPAITFDNVEPDDYILVVQAIGQTGKRSAAASYTITLDGIADPPLPLDSLSLDVPDEGSAVGTLYWDAATQMAVRSGGAIEIRFVAATLGTASWAAATPLGEVPGADSRFGVTLAEGSYLARTRSFDGQLSAEVAGVQYGNPADAGGGGGGTLTVTASPARVSRSGRGSSITSSPIYFDIKGGTAPITISTAVFSGETIAINTPTATSTTLTASPLLLGEPVSGSIRCTVTDSLGATTGVDVPYSFFRYSTTGGGGGPLP